MAELLACRPILHSRDIDATRAFLRSRHVRLDLTGGERDRAGFEVRYNGVYLPRLWLGYIRYGASVSSRVSPTATLSRNTFDLGGVDRTFSEVAADAEPVV